MYCNNCNHFNDDNALFCSNCGARLQRPQDNPPPPPQGNFSAYGAPPQNVNAGGQPNYNYGMPNNTPYSRPDNFGNNKRYTNVIPIVAIVLSVLSVNIVGIVLGVISILKFNEYDKSRFGGNPLPAESAGKMSRDLGIAAIVLSSISLVISIISFFASLFGFGIFGAELFSEIFDDSSMYYYY